MGSGKFGPGDIQALTDHAMQAFHNTFGAPEEPKPQTAPAPQAPAGPKTVPLPDFGPDMVPMPDLILPMPNYDQWKNDPAKYGKKEWDLRGKPWPEVTWDEILHYAKAGDQYVIKALFQMANDKPGDGKWAEANRRKISKAKAVQVMLTNS